MMMSKHKTWVGVVGGLLLGASLPSFAVLRDHGPGDSVLGFPQWYRDFNDLALGICKYEDNAGNGPLCLLGGANPSGFPGNLGDEAFYANLGVKVLLFGAGSFNYVAALEMAYGQGPAPAIRSLTSPDEIVFSRIRIRMDIPPNCGGHYVIRHPFGTNEFDAEAETRGINFTDDVTPIPGDSNAALRGHQGPLLTWDSDQPISVSGREYIGDPNIAHGYTGSAVPTPQAVLDQLVGLHLITAPVELSHPNYLFQNFIEIEGPSNGGACDLGRGSNLIFEPLGNLSGLKWTQAIPTPTRIDRAAYSRSGGNTVLDVWASSAPAQNLVLSPSDSSTPQVPGTTMTALTSPAGAYYAHLEFGNVPPPQVTVTNLTSNPVSRDTKAVVDNVTITQARYDRATHRLCVSAHSGDDALDLPLALTVPAYGALGAPTGSNCVRIAANDQVLEVSLDNFPGVVAPPTEVFVRSALGGGENGHVVTDFSGVSDASVVVQAVDDTFPNVPGSGTTPLNLVAANPSAPDVNLPASYRVVIVSQPAEGGTVTAPASGGVVTFTATAGTPPVDTHFHYAIQDVATGRVSNVAQVDLSVVFTAVPPVGVADNFAVWRNNNTNGFSANVLANDLTGTSGLPIVASSVRVESQGTKGTATANSNGTITYVPKATATAGTDSFTYSVANSSGARSASVAVAVVVQNSAEQVTVSRARFSGSRWDIRFNTSWFGAPLTPNGACYLSTNNGVLINPPTLLIGTAAADATGAFQLRANAGGGVPSPAGNWRITCATSNGGSVVSGPIN